MLFAAAIAAAVTAAAIAGSRHDSGTGGADTATYCGLPAVPGSSVDGVTARLDEFPPSVDTHHAIGATVLLTVDTGHPSVSFTAKDTAYLYFIDDRGHVVGSANFTELGLPDPLMTVSSTGLTVPAAGSAYRCVDEDDPSQSMFDPLPAGTYRITAVLDSSSGPLVTPLVTVTVS